jgi:hypothetical protein
MGGDPVVTHLCVGHLSRARTLCYGETRKGYSCEEFQFSRSNCIFNQVCQSEGMLTVISGRQVRVVQPLLHRNGVIGSFEWPPWWYWMCGVPAQ